MMVDTLVAGGPGERARREDRAASSPRCSAAARGGASREVTEDEMLELEREAFVSLCGEPKSQERMQYMLHEQQAAEELGREP